MLKVVTEDYAFNTRTYTNTHNIPAADIRLLHVTLKGQVSPTSSDNVKVTGVEYIDGNTVLSLGPKNPESTIINVPNTILVTAASVTSTIHLVQGAESMAVQHKIVNASLNGETLNIEAEYESKNFSIGVNQVYEGEATGDVTIEFDEPLVNNETSIEILSTHNVQTGYNQPYVRFDQGRLIVTQTPVLTDESDDTFETIVRLHFTDNSYVDIWVGGGIERYSFQLLGWDANGSAPSYRSPELKGLGSMDLNIPQSVTAILPNTNWPEPINGTPVIELTNSDDGYINIYWNQEEGQWWIDDDDVLNGECKLVVREANH